MTTSTDITKAAEELASAILKAAGTDLKHYTMQKSRDEIIGAAVKGLEAERDKNIASFLTKAEMDIAKERSRQVVEEGWTAEHDDDHVNGELALAACVYAMPLKEANSKHASGFYIWQVLWPWEEKPSGLGDRKRCLVKAGALIVAEIERLDRAAIHKGGE